MTSLFRTIRRVAPLLPTAWKEKGIIDGLADIIKRDVVWKVGLFIQPVIDQPEYSDDAAIVDACIHEAIEASLERRERLPSVTAVFRIKNASAFLYMSVSSFVPLCKEIVIVDNASSDDSLNVCARLQSDFEGITSIRVLSYDTPVSQAGQGYGNAIKRAPGTSLAAYYNFAFSNASSDYVIKADAHTIIMPFGIAELQKAIQDGADIVYSTGVEVYGRRIDFEPRLYRRSLYLNYVDGERWEYLAPQASSGNMLISEIGKQITVVKPMFLHLKSILFARAGARGGRLSSADIYSQRDAEAPS